MADAQTAMSDGGVRSVTRAVELLSLFDVDHPARSLREIVQLTELPKTTVVRLLGTLQSLGLVADRGDFTYSVGAVFLRWVTLSQSLWDVSADTRRVMARLRDDCGETVNLYVRQDLNRICIAQEEGRTTVRSVVRVGVPYALSAGAAAKVLLGGCSDAVLQQLAARDGVPVETLRTEVGSVREAGYAVTHGQRELGASAVAAPIVTVDGRILAALSASGPTSRFTAGRVGSYVDAVTAAARQISEIGLGTVEAFL